MPKRSAKSVILSDLQLSNLISCFPSFYRSSEWKRVFNRDEDGCSLITFFQNTRDYDTTVMLVKDSQGYIFGGFCTEAWKCCYRFFGNGQNFLFSFEREDDPLIYRWQGVGDQHMYANENSIGLGGSNTKGRFALFISNDISRGTSVNVESYENDPLSKN